MITKERLEDLKELYRTYGVLPSDTLNLIATAEKAHEYRDALDRVITQQHGLKNNWAGIFKACPCGDLFAYGGNWSNHSESTLSDLCPCCHGKKVLEDETNNVSQSGEKNDR